MRRQARRGSSSSTRSIRLSRTRAGSALKSSAIQDASATVWTGSHSTMGYPFSIICLTSSSGNRQFGCLRAVIGAPRFNLLARHGCRDGLAMNPELLRSQRNVIAHQLNDVPDVAILDLVEQYDVVLPSRQKNIGSGFQSTDPAFDAVCQGATPQGRFQKFIRIRQ